MSGVQAMAHASCAQIRTPSTSFNRFPTSVNNNEHARDAQEMM